MTLSQGLEILSSSSDNCQNHVTVQLKMVTSAMISGAELNCVLSDIATQTYHLLASSGPITLLEPSKKTFYWFRWLVLYKPTRYAFFSVIFLISAR